MSLEECELFWCSGKTVNELPGENRVDRADDCDRERDCEHNLTCRKTTAQTNGTHPRPLLQLAAGLLLRLAPEHDEPEPGVDPNRDGEGGTQERHDGVAGEELEPQEDHDERDDGEERKNCDPAGGERDGLGADGAVRLSNLLSEVHPWEVLVRDVAARDVELELMVLFRRLAGQNQQVRAARGGATIGYKL